VVLAPFGSCSKSCAGLLAPSPVPRRISDDGRMEWTFAGEVIEWRGPEPYLFVAMTPEDSDDFKEEAGA
jgi:hypothetical protein